MYAMDIGRHHGTRGKMPATTRTMNATAAATTQKSSETRPDEKRIGRRQSDGVSAGLIEEVFMVLAPW